MDGYQFLASLFSSLVSLAWPAALVACVWLFRERLNSLLPLLQMKYKDFDVRFRWEQAEIDARQIAATPSAEEEPTPEEDQIFERLVEISPRSAIMDKRRDLEAAVMTAVERHADTENAPQNVLMATRLLRKRGIVGPYLSGLLDNLRAIGNAAAHEHDKEFSKEDALRFRSLTDEAVQLLSAARMDQMLK